MQKANPTSTVAPKVHCLNLGWFVVYSGVPQMQGTSRWLWRFNPLLLRLLEEISLSLLCSHSSWGSVLDLALPLHVGRLRASVLLSDRMGLKEQLIRGLWLTQARRREGYGMRGEPMVAEASVMFQQPHRPSWKFKSLGLWCLQTWPARTSLSSLAPCACL